MQKIETVHGIITDRSLVRHKDSVLLPETKWGQWFGDITAVIPETDVTKLRLQWEGSPLQRQLFREILSFFVWSYKEYGCEAQVRLYYNPEIRDWKAIPMPQFIQTGLRSREDDTHPDFDKLKLEMDAAGYGHMGSAHHHCNALAFQSGTDYKDEITTEGFHYTIGTLEASTATFHCRCVVRKVNYADVGQADFVPYLAESLCLEDLPEVSDLWKSRMTKEVIPVLMPTVAPTRPVCTRKCTLGFWSKLRRRFVGTRKPPSVMLDPLPATYFDSEEAWGSDDAYGGTEYSDDQYDDRHPVCAELVAMGFQDPVVLNIVSDMLEDLADYKDFSLLLDVCEALEGVVHLMGDEEL